MGKLVGSVFALQLLLGVGLSALAALAAFLGIFFGLGGWGIALAVWFLSTANIGWRGLGMGIGFDGAKHNGDGAFAMLVSTNFLFGAYFAFDPPEFSSLWALLMPITIVPCLIVLAVYEKVLNIINPNAKRA